MPRGTDRSDEALRQGRLWTPRELRGIGTLEAWYDMSDFSTLTGSGGTFSRIEDKSGRGRYFENVTAGQQPTFSDQGLTFAFNSTKFLGAGAGMPTFYDFVIAATPHSSTGAYRNAFRCGTGYHPLAIDTANTNVVVSDSAIRQYGTLTWTGFKQFYCNVPSSTGVQGALDGDAFSSPVSENLVNTAVSHIGGNSTFGQGWGTINELIFLTADRPTHVRQKLEGYLAWKWARLGKADLLSNLIASHLYKNRPPLIGD